MAELTKLDSKVGGCACGALRYRVDRSPLLVQCCHCRNCQRQTGSAFVINVLVEAQAVITEGPSVAVNAPREDGSSQRIFRCPACQVAVYSQYGTPGLAFVRVGTLDDPTALQPEVHVFTRSKLPWVVLPEDVPAFDVYYDEEAVWSPDSLERVAALSAARR